jgi:ADP-ribosylation factor GTPase-activating protein 1
MDKWSDDQIRKMQIGGNDRAKAFFQSQAGWDDKASIKDKYTSYEADLYRDKVKGFIKGELAFSGI